MFRRRPNLLYCRDFAHKKPALGREGKIKHQGESIRILSRIETLSEWISTSKIEPLISTHETFFYFFGFY